MKSFLQLLCIIVFFLGSTFSCIASTNTEVIIGSQSKIIQDEAHDDCCPKDGHKKQIEGKTSIQSSQKQGFALEAYIPQISTLYHTGTFLIHTPVSFYTAPSFDKQSHFFVDTIRLLL